MDKNEACKQLTESLKHNEWFAEVDICPQTKRVTVYVHKMNAEVYAAVPDDLGGLQIMLAFIGYKTVSKDKVTTDLTKPSFAQNVVAKPVMEDLTDYAELASGPELTNELDRLEKICGSNMLQDIFYEVHDGRNAVTNLSARYPEVRESLQRLYDDYGFDIIYEELDG